MQIILLLICYALCRALFMLVNRQELSIQDIGSFAEVMVGGMRFDLSAIAASNVLYIILLMLPLPFFASKVYRRLLAIIFMLTNGVCLLGNLADIAYFPFVHKRSQADALRFVTGEKGGDLFRLLPTFAAQYWYLIIGFVLMMWLLWRGYRYTIQHTFRELSPLKFYLSSSAVLFLSLGLWVLAFRGGLQTKPLNVIHASEMTSVQNIPAIINTPFSIFKSLRQKSMPAMNFFPEEELSDLQGGIHRPATLDSFTRENVVIIIVESLSRKYIGYFGGEASTPFLDSLFAAGYIFPNAFANAKESIQGIPAILSSIPSWQSEPFIFSYYSSNKITSMANLLDKVGYSSSFYHGGYNGTMGFDSYAGLAGFDHYYGKNEYNNNDDYDGRWGIWDEPFLQYAADNMDATSQPFFSAIFTLNPHHPFRIPGQYGKVFNKHRQPFLNCVEYEDYALRRFFERIRTSPWFDNTLFVITADHTAINIEGEQSSIMEDYRIPIVFFRPKSGGLKGKSDIIASQIDILPSVMSLLHYPQPYYSLGTSLFEQTTKRYSINYNGNIYTYIDKDYCYQFNGENPVSLYRWPEDTLCRNNLYSGIPDAILMARDTTLRKMLQQYSGDMTGNRMTYEAIRKSDK